jgi:hypothetical protein
MHPRTALLVSLVATALALASGRPAHAEPPGAGRKVLYVGEAVGNFLLAQFVSTSLHEVVHWVPLKLHGVQTDGVDFIPFQQQVRVSQQAFETMPRHQVFVVAMAPQVLDPLTPNLPRWIYTPDDGTWYLRFSSTYFLFDTVFQSGAVITTTWLEFLGGGEQTKDIGAAGTALTDSRLWQGVFYGGVTAGLGLNLYLRRHDIAQSWSIVTRQRTAWDDRGPVSREAEGARFFFDATPTSAFARLAWAF